ncbi:hypothetical protein [Parafrankia sp. EUN1f]|nr:hypothetical protein [Parafrankia sp. EUN1f]EFC80294.1 hypothetical protein FrEUN1fDRAFT_6588 [Parafrankia sp. EUN1f]
MTLVYEADTAEAALCEPGDRSAHRHGTTHRVRRTLYDIFLAI